MATFDHLPPSRPAPRREKNAPIFCVGWRAFVHWPPRVGSDGLEPVPLLDANGKPLANDLVDGQQVEIVSWRPRSREGLVYQVRRVADGSEWWIGAQYLRRDPRVAAATAPHVGVTPR
ncbi:MAG TPA: hypothetical protein VMW17_18425 [Candidatus Binatia bacterium]|nr:hypothetical protein [Candidatus Binatia bacterium]